MKVLLRLPIEKDYIITERVMAGIVLVGHEIKHLLSGNASIQSAWIDFNKPLSVKQLKIAPIRSAFSPKEDREKLLLLSKKEISDLKQYQKSGYVILVEAVIYKNKKAKLQIAVGKKIKKGDKRQVLINKEHQKEIKDLH